MNPQKNTITNQLTQHRVSNVFLSINDGGVGYFRRYDKQAEGEEK
jgi:hypothetical protein